jgi:hypothetical protein
MVDFNPQRLMDQHLRSTEIFLGFAVAQWAVRLDGAHVVKTKASTMNTLTTDQKQQLVEILVEDFGEGMEFEDFTDALLGLLENIAGFETASQSVIDKLTQQIWRKYHG